MNLSRLLFKLYGGSTKDVPSNWEKKEEDDPRYGIMPSRTTTITHGAKSWGWAGIEHDQYRVVRYFPIGPFSSYCLVFAWRETLTGQEAAGHVSTPYTWLFGDSRRDVSLSTRFHHYMTGQEMAAEEKRTPASCCSFYLPITEEWLFRPSLKWRLDSPVKVCFPNALMLCMWAKSDIISGSSSEEQGKEDVLEMIREWTLLIDRALGKLCSVNSWHEQWLTLFNLSTLDILYSVFC